MLGVIIGNPKYLEGHGILGGPNGFKLPPPRSNGYVAKSCPPI